MNQIRRSASIYFAVQGAAVLAWWGLLYLAPWSRSYFQMGESETLLLAFWLPDLILLAAGSLITSAFCFSDSRLTVPAAWFVVGTISYASIFCFSFALKTDTGWLGVTLMLPAMIMSGNFAIGLTPVFEGMMFRRSRDAQTSWILAKTLTQLVVVWSLILLVIPWFILQVELKLGISQFAFPLQKPLSLIVFFALSSIGVSSAYTMAKIGRGTPLPVDAASKLVTCTSWP